MSRTERILVLLALGVALVMGCLSRFEHARTLDGDEAPSFMAAACQQRRVADVLEESAPPVAQWVPVEAWRKFVLPKDFFCFGEISAGLAETDRHPPLYFWLLHVWLLAFGATLGAVLWLNLVLGVATGTLLYFLALRLFRKPVAAAVSVLVWAVNPRTLETGQLGRHYQLFALVTVLFAWTCVREVQRSPRRGLVDVGPLAAVSCLGLLVHYQFLFVAAAGGAYLLWAVGPRQVLPHGLGVVTGLVASNVFHPTLHSMLGPPVGPASDGSRARSAARVLGEAGQFLAAILYGGRSSPPVAWVVAASALLVLGALGAGLWLHLRERSADARFLVVPVLVLAAMWLTQRLGFGPSHMGYPRHLAAAQTLLALLPGYLVAALKSPPLAATGAALVALAALVTSARALVPKPDLQASRSRQIQATCKKLVIPSQNRRVILATAYVLGGKVQVLAGRRNLLEPGLDQAHGESVCLLQTSSLAQARKLLESRGVKIKAEIDPEYRLKNVSR